MSLNAIRSDNEREYTGLFEEYCTKHWIKHETIILKTKQQNGLADWIYLTIYEKVQSMLSYAKLSKIFLDEAVRTATDIINLSPVYVLEMDVLEHVWTRKNVNYKHVKVFGYRSCLYLENSQD